METNLLNQQEKIKTEAKATNMRIEKNVINQYEKHIKDRESDIATIKKAIDELEQTQDEHTR